MISKKEAMNKTNDEYIRDIIEYLCDESLVDGKAQTMEERELSILKAREEYLNAVDEAICEAMNLLEIKMSYK